uniref:Uncharacterized protein n=1 Tax=Triticum urartu TaxID=4572 RepID=A0A8R7V8Q9_TRIUA
MVDRSNYFRGLVFMVSRRLKRNISLHPFYFWKRQLKRHSCAVVHPSHSFRRPGPIHGYFIANKRNIASQIRITRELAARL